MVRSAALEIAVYEPFKQMELVTDGRHTRKDLCFVYHFYINRFGREGCLREAAAEVAIRGEIMRKMDFLNYTQRPYTNVTVRLGYKWANLQIGEAIQLCDNGLAVEDAVVRQIVVKRFMDIKLEDIKREHDPARLTKNSLRRAMRKAYPDFFDTDVVTIVTYVRGK